MRRHLLIYAGLVVSIWLLPWIVSSLSRATAPSLEPARTTFEAVKTMAAITPLPEPRPLDPRRVELGERLFVDPRLSSDNSVSCHDCHNLTTGGVDLLPRSTGVGGFLTPFNTPTVFNVEHNFRLLWNGRFEDLETQIDRLIQHSAILQTSWEEILGKIRLDQTYLESFRDAYDDGLSIVSIRDALITYQRSLVTPDAPFDEYLRGDEASLSVEEKKGYEKFLSYGCVSCHQGVNIGGNIFQTFGIMKEYYRSDQVLPEEYLGRYNVTGKEEDKFVYRVPSLRNVAVTPPYFHDGSAETLEEAVRVMAEYQLGRILSDSDVSSLVAFLGSLTGEYRGRSLAAVAVQ